jgi:hypothetical protein
MPPAAPGGLDRNAMIIPSADIAGGAAKRHSGVRVSKTCLFLGQPPEKRGASEQRAERPPEGREHAAQRATKHIGMINLAERWR